MHVLSSTMSGTYSDVVLFCVLQLIYQQFYKVSSAGEPGTLSHLRNTVGRVDVHGPEEVIQKYRYNTNKSSLVFSIYTCLHVQICVIWILYSGLISRAVIFANFLLQTLSLFLNSRIWFPKQSHKRFSVWYINSHGFLNSQMCWDRE